MKRARKILSLLLAASMLLGMNLVNAAAEENTEETQESAADEAPLADETVRIAISFDPATMEPWAVMGDGRVDVLRCVYEYLFDYETIGGDLLPLIASGYEQVDDLTYKVTIFDNIYDSKGNHITADDVVFSYEGCIEKGDQAVGMSSIESVTALDETTIEMKFNTTAAGTFANSVTNVCIVSQKEYEADPDHFASHPVGTGAYVLDEFVPGSSVKFSRRDDYWQTPDKRAKLSQANIGHVEYRVIPEASQLTIALESGDVDVAYFIPSSDIHRFEDTEGYKVEGRPRDLAEVLLFNCDPGNVFASKELRQAVCCAIDSSVILQNTYDGAGGVCKTYGAPLFADYNHDWDNEDYYEYDLDRAKELLTQAGYPDGVKVRLMTDNSTIHVRMAQVIQSLLGQIGIEVEILQYDGTLINTYRFDPTQFDFYIATKSSFDYITSVWKFSFDANSYKGKTLNFYEDSELQSMLETALDEKTHTPENINALHEYLKDICIGYGVCYGTNYLVANDKIDTLAIDYKTRVVGGACTFTDAFE